MKTDMHTLRVGLVGEMYHISAGTDRVSAPARDMLCVNQNLGQPRKDVYLSPRPNLKTLARFVIYDTAAIHCSMWNCPFAFTGSRSLKFLYYTLD